MRWKRSQPPKHPVLSVVACVVGESMKSNLLTVGHKLSILVTARASLQINEMSGLPIRAKYNQFRTICEHTFDNSPTDSSSSFLKWWSSKQGLETVRNISQRTFEHVLPCRKTKQPSLREVFPTLVIFQLLQQKIVIRTFFCIRQ